MYLDFYSESKKRKHILHLHFKSEFKYCLGTIVRKAKFDEVKKLAVER